LVVEREWNATDSEPEVFRRALLEDFVKLVQKLSLTARLRTGAERLAGWIGGLVRGVSVSYEGVEVRHQGTGEQTLPRRFDEELREALEQVGRLCERSDHPGVILRYDEFHAVEERRGQLTLSALLSAVAAVQQREVPAMLVLCGLPTLIEHLTNSKSYSERMFHSERLANLRPAEARAALTQPAEEARRHFADDVVDAVLKDTEGYPYFIQLYGDTLWKRSEGETITTADFARLRPYILQELDDLFFEGRYQKATARERRILHAIATDGGESATVKRIQQLAVVTNNELQPLVANLVRKGLVYRPGRGEVAFTAPMFGAYLRRVGPQ